MSNLHHLGLMTCLVAGCAARIAENPKPAGSSYKAETDSFEVASVEEIVLRDESRGKDLSVSVRYPKGDGPFPAVVFSHGAGGSGKNDFPLTSFWAGRGYVVLQPTHADSGLSQKGGLRDLRERIEKEIENPEAIENRAKDVSFLLDSLESIEAKAPELRGKIDRTRIGVGGHSFGALTSVAIAGASFEGKTYADARPRAILLLSGQGRGPRTGLAEDSWSQVTRPMMVMTGSRDRGLGGETVEWRLEPYKFSPPGDKYSVWIEGATHGSFTGALADEEGERTRRQRRIAERTAKGTDQKAVFEQVKRATLAFWDAYLKESPQAKALLRSDEIQSGGGGLVRYEKK